MFIKGDLANDTATTTVTTSTGAGLAALIPGAAGATATEEESVKTDVSRETGLKWLPIEQLAPIQTSLVNTLMQMD